MNPKNVMIGWEMFVIFCFKRVGATFIRQKSYNWLEKINNFVQK
jgi:hypothetical protein